MNMHPKKLTTVLLVAGLACLGGTAMAEERFYDPTNTAPGNDQGKTTTWDDFGTIGCPGRQLLDPPCPKPVVAKPAPPPPPAPAPKPAKAKCMENAKPGECFVMLVKEPVYRTEKVKKLVKEAGERIEIVPPVYKAVRVHVTSEEVQEVIPAVYETVKESVVVKPATTRLETVPAVFEEVEERVIVKPATTRAVEVPAVYEDVTKQVLVRAAYSTWKPGTSTPIQKIDDKTGEIFCLVEVPAEYQTVTTRVLKTPASIQYENVPAEYGTIKKTVLKTPETTRSVPVPAEYAEREVTKLVKPAQTITKTVPVDYMREIMTEVTPATQKRVPVPAQYEDVEQQVLVTPAMEYCTQILCDVNATSAKVTEIQTKLQAAGFYSGPIDGILGPVTNSAVADYQRAKGLTQDGYLTVETLNSLGVSFK